MRELHEELLGYPGGYDTTLPASNAVLPLRFDVGGTELVFFALSGRVETAADVTVDELRIETFYPADDATVELLRRRAV